MMDEGARSTGFLAPSSSCSWLGRASSSATRLPMRRRNWAVHPAAAARGRARPRPPRCTHRHRRKLRRRHDVQDDQGHVERSHARNDVLRLRLDDHGRWCLQPHCERRGGDIVDERRADQRHQLLFEVVAVVGNNWASTKSSASAESTINGTNPFCVQP